MKYKFGLQLYSVRDHMEKDFEGTLQKVAEMGYEYVEFAGYFGHTGEEIKQILDKNGLKCVSVHQTVDPLLEEGTDDFCKFLKTFGVKYFVIPYYPLDEFQNNYEKTLEKFQKAAEICARNNLILCYHNHDFEFRNNIGNMRVIDKLLADMEGKLLPQFDLCWVKYGGAEPCEYLKKYQGKVEIVHLKDFYSQGFDGTVYKLIDKDGKVDDKKDEQKSFEYRPLGQGVQKMEEIIESADQNGTQYFIVEQDDWYDKDSLATVQESIEYLKKNY